MLTLRTMKQIPTYRTIPGCRSCPSLSSNHGIILDQGRMVEGYAQLLASDAHRKWRNRQWKYRS